MDFPDTEVATSDDVLLLPTFPIVINDLLKIWYGPPLRFKRARAPYSCGSDTEERPIVSIVAGWFSDHLHAQ